MSSSDRHPFSVALTPLVLGTGNTLLSDDGVGVHVARALERALTNSGGQVRVRDGGTIGLSLLAELDPGAPLIAVDATELHAEPGTLRIFEGAEMDRQLRGAKRSAHEVALADLIQAADFAGIGPGRRALVAIQPEVTTWGMAPTRAVAEAVPRAVDRIMEILEDWDEC